MSKRYSDIAILPLNEALLFPNMILPMRIFEERFIKMIDYVMNSTKKIAVTLNRPGFEEEPMIGGACCLGDVTYAEEATLEDAEGKAVIVSGTKRARITETSQTKPFIIGNLEEMPEKCSSQTAFRQCKEKLPKILIQYLFLQNVSEKDLHLANLIVDPAHIADFVAFYFIKDMDVKYAFLETEDICERCKKIEKLLESAMKEPPQKTSK